MLLKPSDAAAQLLIYKTADQTKASMPGVPSCDCFTALDVGDETEFRASRACLKCAGSGNPKVKLP